jgi:DNA-nicking Smr family endonuclease
MQQQQSPPKSATQSAKKKYPWSHIFTTAGAEDNEEDDGILDIVEAPKEIKRKQKVLEEMKTISKASFDKLSEENDLLKQELEAARELLNESILHELKGVIITQAVIAHSRKMSENDSKEKIVSGVRKWLQQKSKVHAYLMENNLFEEEQEAFGAILNDTAVERNQLFGLIRQFLPPK